LPTLQLRLGRGQIAQSFLPLGFQTARHQPVFRLHGAILALGTLSLVARTFYGKPPLAECRIVIGFQLLDRLFGSFHRGRRQRLQKGFRHRLVNLDATNVKTVQAASLDDVFARAVIARRGVSAAIMRVQMPATLTTDSQTLQQCGAFSHCAACLVRLRMDVGVDARLVGLVSRPVDETMLVIGKKHRPLRLGKETRSPAQSSLFIDVTFMTALAVRICAYFRLAQTPRVWQELDQWMRHRMRAIQLKHWKCAKTIYQELLARKASPDVAAQVAANARRWWRNSGMLLNSVLDLAWADRLGIPRLC